MTREELDALHGRSGEAMTRLSHLSGNLGDTDFIASFIGDVRRMLGDLMLKELDALEADLRSGHPTTQMRAAAGISRMFSPPSGDEREMSEEDLQRMIDRLRLGETASIKYHVSHNNEVNPTGGYRDKIDEIEANLNDPDKRPQALIDLINIEADVLVIDTLNADSGKDDDDTV